MSRTPTLPSGEAPVSSRTITDPLVARATSDIQSAQEAFRRGEMAMRRDQFALAITEFARAKELGPKEPDYDAMLAWAKFCEAIDKKAIAAETRKILEGASRRADKPMLAMFYLGRVERMLGRDKEALVHFQAVLDLQPHHKDAASEVRVLEGRLADKGLFGLKR
jgi:cytochrome c-type biogenesis protein CcmH/NrfG